MLPDVTLVRSWWLLGAIQGGRRVGGGGSAAKPAASAAGPAAGLAGMPDPAVKSVVDGVEKLSVGEKG